MFDENLSVIKKLSVGSIPICIIFSEAGALVANRYGLFWNLTNSSEIGNNLNFIFESTEVLKFNIKRLLDKTSVSYSVLPDDPAFSSAIALANKFMKCIIVSPLSTNTAAKLVHGISDTFMSNFLAAGLKAGKKLVIVPTDVDSGPIESQLPVRQKISTTVAHINPNICEFRALRKTLRGEIIFLPHFCVGCEVCVKRYPQVFSVREKIEIQIREVDHHNVELLKKECIVFRKPTEILAYIEKHYC